MAEKKSPSDTDTLQRELYATKEYASELSGANERSKKEIGSLRKEVAAGEELKEQIATLQAAADQDAAKIKALESALTKASKEAEAGRKAVEAGKTISDALGQLSAL